MRKRVAAAFDFNEAIPAAWKLLWAENMRTRAKGDAFRASQTYYLTASDVEVQVRAFAEAAVNGEPRPTTRAYGGYGFEVRISGNLQGRVRSWLLNEVSRGRLASHNFGRGHISGMRFRPACEPISEAEMKTIAAKAARRDKPLPCHLRGKGGRPSCSPPRKGGYFGRPSKSWTTSDASRVTCQRCLKLLAAHGGVCETEGPRSHFDRSAIE